MSLETEIANLVTATNQLTGEVSGKMVAINQTVDAKKAELDAWKASAKSGYPALNLFNNALLRKLNSDGSPKGFYFHQQNCNVNMIVMPDGEPGWWTDTGKLLRMTVSAAGATPYIAMFPSVPGYHLSNSPNIPTTRGFEYRVISLHGGAAASIAWENGGQVLDLTKTEWTKRVLTTYESPQTSSILAVNFFNQPADSYLVIELRNIFVNLGEANSFSLGLSEITDLTI